MSDSSLLRVAASRLRELAEGARLWTFEDSRRVERPWHNAPEWDDLETEHAAYIAAMSPLVGLAVDNLLDTIAEAVEDDYPIAPFVVVRAVAVARAVVPQGDTDA